MKGIGWLVLLAALAAAAPARAADVPVPPLERRVTDLTGSLSAPTQERLEQRLASFERDKGSQVAVLIVPTTEPETIEQYGIRVGEAWKLGRAKADDGAILLIAKGDRRLRIEVGHGLEGALNDATAKRIIDEHIVPRLKAGDFDGAVSTGVDRILKVIEGEPLPAVERGRGAPRGGAGFGDFIPFLLFGALAIVPLAVALLGRLLTGLVGGGLAAGVALLLGAGIALALFFAVLTFFLVQIVGVGGGRAGRHVWMGGGGGFGGGSGGGGGFSGGGGSFGGGGASGSW